MGIKGCPCKVENVPVSKTGKHGHAKCNFVAKDIFTGKRLEDIVPSTHGTTVPNVFRGEYMVLDIELSDDASAANPTGASLSCMAEDTGEEFNALTLPSFPETLAKEVYDVFQECQGDDGEKAGHNLFVSTLSAVGNTQIVGYRTEA